MWTNTANWSGGAAPTNGDAVVIYSRAGSLYARKRTGGAWSSERDLVVRLLEELGWERAYHRVRIGPGKAIAFGTWKGNAYECAHSGSSMDSDSDIGKYRLLFV